jgi:hypothetical protein
MWKIFHHNIFNPKFNNSKHNSSKNNSSKHNSSNPFVCLFWTTSSLVFFIVQKKSSNENVRQCLRCNDEAMLEFDIDAMFFNAMCPDGHLMWYFVFNVLRSTLNENVLKYCQCQKNKYWLLCFLFTSWDQYCIQYFMSWGKHCIQ